ncbi:glycoside hydrolase family 28 protein [Apiospora marii]|uniref:glycoside hydrolase family 28 protein n=1 Tax=Apiospora marii TaxID=335849 RepID=UPI0031308E5E
MFAKLLLPFLAPAAAASFGATLAPRDNNVCVVEPAANGSDSAPAILEAFERCGHNPAGDASQRGKVVFKNETYHIQSVMNTTGLCNVDVDLQGTLLWDQNIPYWLNHSLPVGYQNQSSAWLFGGENVHWDGHGYGTLDGNGQVWYDFVNGTNNYPGRIRFVQSQMWTVTIIHSENILMEDIYVNSTDTKQEVGFDFSSLNTDGADTVYANNITFRRWVVDNGDDSIAMKANSTNILIEDCRFHTGLGIAIGSIGQYDGEFEIIENVTARNIQILDQMRYGVYVKTWTGRVAGYPPNGGGGGLGYAANMLFQNFTLDGATGIFAVTQCTSYNDATGGCDTSEFHVRDLVLDDWHGTAVSDVVAAVQCSAARPCTGIEIKGIDIVDTVNGTAPASYLCDNVSGPQGFACTGPTWEENNR